MDNLNNGTNKVINLVRDELEWNSFYENSDLNISNFPSKVDSFNRLIMHTNNFFAIAGYGAFNEGYIMIISKKLRALILKIKMKWSYIKNIINYSLPIQKGKTTINTLTDLIISVFDQYVDQTDKDKTYLAIHSESYEYCMAYIDPHKINIPESIIKNDPVTPFLTIIIKKDGEVFIDSKNRKKELQKKAYLEILRARKPSEISLKIDSETPSEYFLKILKTLENEKIKKVVIETNYLKE